MKWGEHTQYTKSSIKKCYSFEIAAKVIELGFFGNVTVNQHTPGEMSALPSEDPVFNWRVKLPCSTRTPCEQPPGNSIYSSAHNNPSSL